TALAIGLMTQSASAATLKIVVEGIRSTEGSVRIAVFASEADWLKNGVRAVAVKPAVPKTSAVVENLEPGEYAISVMADENDNGFLDVNAMGIPKEPYGFSNGAKGVFGPAKWVDAKFRVDGDGVIRIRLD
ncbi:MAG TPA: DUF2141 domain-containing protein, partial [Opitutales bacterium]|nr:DUF2141 domain-containing protein [Opitutales bacterium]